MIKKYLSLSLICLLAIGANFSLTAAQTGAEGENTALAKIKATIAKRENSKNKRVEVKMRDGKKLKGSVVRSSADSFVLTNPKTNQDVSIDYADVTEVKSGGLSKGDKIAIGIVVGAAVVAAIVLGSFLKTYCDNEGC